MDRYNFAARAGRWSAAHWKTAFFGWLAFVVVAVGLGMSVGTHTLSSSEQSSGETARRSRSWRARASRRRRRRACSSSRGADRRRPGLQVDRAEGAGEVAGDAAGDEPAHGCRRPDLEGPARAADRVRHEGKPGHRGRARAAAAGCGHRLSEGEPWLHGRRVRLCERDARVEQDDRQGLPEGGEAFGADHLPDPADRVRGVRRGRRAGAARVLGRARLGRPVGDRQPRLPCLRRDPVGDPADGDGGRGRLLALLLEARAGGAGGRTQGPRRALPCRRNVRAGCSDLRVHGADRDGRDAVCRHEDLHLDRDRGDARRLHLSGRLADRAAGAARQARRPHRARPAPGARRRPARPPASAQAAAALAGLAARDADAAAAREGRPAGVAGLGFRDRQVDAPSGGRGRSLGRPSARACAAGAGDAHEAARASPTCRRA